MSFLFFLLASGRNKPDPGVIIFLFCLLVAGLTQLGAAIKGTLGKKLDDFQAKQINKKRKIIYDEEEADTTAAGDDMIETEALETADKLRKTYAGFSTEQLQDILGAPRGEYLPLAVKIAREELNKRI